MLAGELQIMNIRLWLGLQVIAFQDCLALWAFELTGGLFDPAGQKLQQETSDNRQDLVSIVVIPAAQNRAIVDRSKSQDQAPKMDLRHPLHMIGRSDFRHGKRVGCLPNLRLGQPFEIA